MSATNRLADELREFLPKPAVAAYVQRSPRTVAGWALQAGAPLRPALRLGRGYLWRTADVRAVLGEGVAQ